MRARFSTTLCFGAVGGLLLFALCLIGEATTNAQGEEPYSYQGARFRDPFVPLTGPGVKVTLAEDVDLQIEGVRLKGILEDKKGQRFAVIMDNVGASYLVQRGKVIDARGKQVRGVSGVVKKKSIVLITSDKTVTEIKFDRPEENGG